MKINLLCAINHLSYGIVGLNILKSLAKLGHEISLFPLDLDKNIAHTESAVQQALNNAAMYNPDAPSVRIWHQNNHSLYPLRGRTFGFPIFELDKFTDVELHHLNLPDKLIVCSKWAKNVCVANGLKEDNINVVPLGVDTNIFKHNLNVQNWEETRFFVIGKFEIRKAHKEIGAAFNKAFSPSDKVSLTFLCYNIFESPEENDKWASMFLNSPMGRAGKVHVHSPVATQQDVAKYICLHDCMIDYSKAEGWGLPALEALACGKHIIATDYSGHTEFLNKDNAALISVDKLVPAHATPWFYGQGNWAKLERSQEDQLINAMRDIHSCKQNQKLEINVEGIKTAEQFSWDNAAKTLVEVLQKP